jgi:circadian clock protein KaiC
METLDNPEGIVNSGVENSSLVLAKAPTGIIGFDEITRGGLPNGRATLVCGGPGCGKTVLAMEFLVRGALEFDEPGLFVSFEENPKHLIENFRSLGFNLLDLIAARQLKISHVELSSGEIIEAGAFSLDGLLIRLEHSIAEIGAKRLVLDTMETIFSALADTERLRNEIGRLFHWLRDKGITTIVTGERGREELTRYGFEEYISDCVILLDHRVDEQLSKRRMRIVKYRGSSHGTNEFPFFIGETGFFVLPITSLTLDHTARSESLSTGVQDLDKMLGGKGYFQATTALITGKAGTGKSSLAAAFAVAACERGERCLCFSFEESESQMVRNMKSIGMDLDLWLRRGLLRIRAFRPTLRGLEEHLVTLVKETNVADPTCVILDPITNFLTVGGAEEVKSMLTRILDHLKHRGVTLLMTALTNGSGRLDETEMHVSSLVDTWIALDLERTGNTRRRSIYVVKSRGMEHSHETRELVMSSRGLCLNNVNVEVGA